MGQENFSQLQASAAEALKRPVTWERLLATDNFGAGMGPLPGEIKTGTISEKKRLLTRGLFGAAALTGVVTVLENFTNYASSAAAAGPVGDVYYQVPAGGGPENSPPVRKCAIFVNPGDSLSVLEAKFGLPRDTLLQSNGLTTTIIHPGDVLTFPSNSSCSGYAQGGSENPRFADVQRMMRTIKFTDIEHPVDGHPLSWNDHPGELARTRGRLTKAMELAYELNIDPVYLGKRLKNFKISLTDGQYSFYLPGKRRMEITAQDTDTVGHEFAHHLMGVIVDQSGRRNIALTEIPPTVFANLLGGSEYGQGRNAGTACQADSVDYDRGVGVRALNALEKFLRANGKNSPTMGLTAYFPVIYAEFIGEKGNSQAPMPEPYLFKKLGRIFDIDPSKIENYIKNDPDLSCYR